jgi:putative transposase
MQRTYKFRLYPTKENEQKLLWTLDRCRFVYNQMLDELNKQNKPNRLKLQAMLPKLKQQHSELKDVYSKALQYETYRLFSNLRALARLKKNKKKVGKLRFKGRYWFKTFSYNQSGFKIIKHTTRFDTLHLSKIGDIPMLMHRKIEGEIKQVTIKHQPSGRWFVSIIAETKEIVKPTQNTNKIGIDLGLKNFVYDSDGNKFEHPRCLSKSLNKLAKEQRKLSRKKKSSKNRIKQRIKVARVHEKIINQRDDFLHKLSRHYVERYGFIAVENLNIKGIVRNHYLARSIIDASWSRFIQMLEYKAESAGIQVVKVDPKGTTQKCSQCGRIIKKSLAVRTHKCSCGLIIDRDYNSTINILKKALGREPSEFTPVETEPLLLSNQGQVQSQKQEAPCKSVV